MFSTHREPLTSLPSVTSRDHLTDPQDKPISMAMRTEEVKEIIVRAESLHINNPPHQADKERINPNTGHMEPGDEAAIN